MDGVTTEFISLNKGPEKGPDLPFGISSHQMVQVNSKAIYLIGGNEQPSYKKMNKTLIIDPTNNFDFKEGPPMNVPRSHHSCATMKLNGKVFIVVVGGISYKEMDDGTQRVCMLACIFSLVR